MASTAGNSDLAKTTNRWRIHKFGGTSLAEAKCFQRVKSIISTCGTESVAVVCSAMGGRPKVTDLLLSACRLAAMGESQVESYQEIIEQIRNKHIACAEAILSPEGAEELIDTIDQDISQIQDILRAVSLMRFEFEPISELVSGYGELWSTQVRSLSSSPAPQPAHDCHPTAAFDR